MSTSEKDAPDIHTASTVSSAEDFTVLGALLVVEEITDRLLDDESKSAYDPKRYGLDGLWVSLHRVQRQVQVWGSSKDPQGTGAVEYESALVITAINDSAGVRFHFYKTRSDDPIGYPQHVDTLMASDPNGKMHTGWKALFERTLEGLVMEVFGTNSGSSDNSPNTAQIEA